MLGAAPPMPVEAAASFARLAHENVRAAARILEVVVLRASNTAEPRWSYLVRASTERWREEPIGAFELERPCSSAMVGCRIEAKDLIPSSTWPDQRKPPRTSFAKAVALARDYLSKLAPPRDPIELHAIRLLRVGHSKHWFYAVSFESREAYLQIFVTMDGRVLPLQKE